MYLAERETYGIGRIAKNENLIEANTTPRERWDKEYLGSTAIPLDCTFSSPVVLRPRPSREGGYRKIVVPSQFWALIAVIVSYTRYFQGIVSWKKIIKNRIQRMSSCTRIQAIHILQYRPISSYLCPDTISATCVPLRPFPANSLRILLILLVMFRDISGERVIRIGRAEKGLYRQKDSTDLQSRGPFIYGN